MLLEHHILQQILNQHFAAMHQQIEAIVNGQHWLRVEAPGELLLPEFPAQYVVAIVLHFFSNRSA